ncbi:MAG: c-type cytochrome [Rhizobium sp.]|nr:c-type cytochrome [Rhizobium sp.]
MKYVTLLTMLAPLSLAACDQSGMTPAGMGMAPTPMQTGPRAMRLPELPAVPAQPAPTAAASSDGSPAIQSDLAHGLQVYRQTCAFCHDKGIAGAPIIGEASDWRPRLAQGMTALYASALQGRNAMPAKGGNPSLADADVRAAVDYLAGQVH